MSTHLALPREVHILQLIHVFTYLNIHNKMGLVFIWLYIRIRPNLFKEYYWFYFYRYTKEAIHLHMPESRVNEVSIYAFVDYDIARKNSSSCNQTGSWYLIISLPSAGIAIVRQMLKQVILEQSSFPWRQVRIYLMTYVTLK